MFKDNFHLAAKVTLIVVVGIHCMSSSARRTSG